MSASTDDFGSTHTAQEQLVKTKFLELFTAQNQPEELDDAFAELFYKSVHSGNAVKEHGLTECGRAAADARFVTGAEILVSVRVNKMDLKFVVQMVAAASDLSGHFFKFGAIFEDDAYDFVKLVFREHLFVFMWAKYAPKFALFVSRFPYVERGEGVWKKA